METVKEKLIKLILAFGECPADRCLACEYQYEHDCGALMFAEQLIQNGVTIQEWVSVDERLPEESGDYLVIANSGAIFRYYYSHEELEFGEYVEIELDFVEKPDTVWISLNTITHWMPIPALPKGVQ